MPRKSRENGDGHAGPEVAAALNASGMQSASAIQALFASLCHQCTPPNKSAVTPADTALDLLRDRAALSRAQNELLLKSQDKAFDVVF